MESSSQNLATPQRRFPEDSHLHHLESEKHVLLNLKWELEEKIKDVDSKIHQAQLARPERVRDEHAGQIDRTLQTISSKLDETDRKLEAHITESRAIRPIAPVSTAAQPKAQPPQGTPAHWPSSAPV